VQLMRSGARDILHLGHREEVTQVSQFHSE
jgi:hypothetical protein